MKLLGGFALTYGDSVVELPGSAQRLLAFLALGRGPQPRSVVAGSLWGERSEGRAHASLRSALWRLHRPGHHLVDAAPGVLEIAEGVAVDITETVSAARAVVAGRDAGDPELDPAIFTGELLPGWYDEWIVVERERLRQLCLHGLEALARLLLGEGSCARALEVALGAVRCEPLRESAHRLLVEIHLAEGNRSEAVRQCRRFEELLRAELGIAPSPALRALVDFAESGTAPA